MEPDKTKIKEPFPPEHTPNPPQIIDPSPHKEKNEDDDPVKGKSTGNKSSNDNKPVKKTSSKG